MSPAADAASKRYSPFLAIALRYHL